MNLEPARHHMIYHQVRPWDVLDDRVLNTLGDIPRERFAPEKYRQLAFADTSIPLPCGQAMLKPVIEGRLLQALQAEDDHRSLLVGTGSGFMTACVAALSDHVTSIDIHSELVDSAAQTLADEKIRNVELQALDFNDYSPSSGFDRIIFTGSMPVFDKRLPEWLNDGGRMILVTGEAPAMTVEQVTRSGDEYARRPLFETVIPVLENVTERELFSF